MALNVMLCERALLALERQLPYLRRHVMEYSQDPTAVHADQIRSKLQLVRKAVWNLLDQLPRTDNLQTRSRVANKE